MKFIRIWLGLYVGSLLYSLIYRVIDHHVMPFMDLLANVFALAFSLAAIFYLRKRNYKGNLLLKVLSISRMSVNLMIASVFFAFVAGMVPAGPAFWLWAIKLPASILIVYSLSILILEIIFFRKISLMNKQHR